MEQNTHLLKEQLNRIEFMLMDIKQSAAITQRVVCNSSSPNPKPVKTKGGKK
jgi:hypothetical protein